MLSYEEYLKQTNQQDSRTAWKWWKIEACGMSEKEAIKTSITEYEPLSEISDLSRCEKYDFFVDGEKCESVNICFEDDTEYNYFIVAGQIQKDTRKRVDVYKDGIYIDTV